MSPIATQEGTELKLRKSTSDDVGHKPPPVTNSQHSGDGALVRDALSNDHQLQNQGKKVDRRKQTVLEQHCGFFDRDGDGVLWMTETYRTCRDFDWSVPLSLFFAGFLHVVQSWGTVPWKYGFPDPLFRIWIHNVQFNKHGSSTMAFDFEGNFRPHIMDEFFDKFDRDGKGGLTFEEGWTGVRRIRNAWDIFGQVSAAFEWGFCYLLVWPESGVVTKAEARRVLDGTYFHEKIDQKRKYAKANGIESRW